MSQLTIGEIKQLINDIPDDHVVFFRRVAPIFGNIEEVGGIGISTYSSFGKVIPCVIIEPMIDD